MASSASEIDIASVRADTPGVGHVAHLNNAGSSLPPAVVLETQREYLATEAVTGGYELKDARVEEVESVYDSIASLLGAQPDEIALTSNATESWQLAFHSIRLGPGDRILTSEASYASNFIGYLHAARRTGVTVEVAPSDPAGQVDVEGLESMIDGAVKLVALTHVPTNGGLVNPAAEVGAVARQHGIPYLLDACQSVGQLEVDVGAIGCDFLSATGRKFLRAPRGTGLLYASRSILETTEPPFLDLHGATWTTPGRYEVRSDARRYENWEFNYAAVLGLGAAVRYALDVGMGPIERRVRRLGALLRNALATAPGIRIHDLGSDPCAIVTFSHPAIEASEFKTTLAEEGINVSYTTPASTLIDATSRSLPDMVRVSPHYYNDESELERVAEVVRLMTR